MTVGYVSTTGTLFSGTVTANNAPVASWSFTAGQNGYPESGTAVIPYTAPAGPFTLTAAWHFSSGETGTLPAVTQTCSPPPAPQAPPTPAPAAPQAPTATPTAATSASPPAPVTRKRHRRFGVAGKHRKTCAHGRRHLTDHNGRRFTVCRSAQPIVRTPSFTG